MSEIRFYNRYSQQEEVEEIYGEAFLRWTYETTMGRMGLWLLAKRAVFSHWYGWRMNKSASRIRVRDFIETYGLDEDEFLDATESYSTFNDFFYRKLKSSARPIAGDEQTVVLPADGRHMALQNVSTAEGLYVKGQRFDLAAFLGDVGLAQTFEGGSIVISRLCPVDYHRYHSPVSGNVKSQRLINGTLSSVSPIALRRSAAYLWENKRVLSVIESKNFGTVAFVAIGATCVGSIKMTAQTGQKVERGDELGYFAFGGSCVVSFFERGKVDLAKDLAERGAVQQEVYAKVGDVLGREFRKQ